MSITYTPATDFSVKDGLTTGDPAKKIQGATFDTEFDAISTAFGLAAPVASPTFTGTTTIPTVDINGGNIDGTIIGSVSPQTGNFSTLSINGTSITATAAELNYVDGVTSAIQTQLDAKAPTASPTFTGDATFAGIVEGIQAYTSGGTIILNGSDTIVTFDVTASVNLGSTSLAAGESVTIMFNTTSTITWPTGIKWVGGSAPTINTGLTTGQYQVVQIWKVGTTHYGAYTGELT